MDNNININSLSYSQIKDLLYQNRLDPLKAVAALFTYGYRLEVHGSHDEAEAIYQETIAHLDEAYMNPKCEFGMQDYGDCAFEHGFNLYKLGRLDLAIASYREATAKYRAFISMCASAQLIAKLASSLRWLAVAEHQSGASEKAAERYREALSLYRSISRFGALGIEQSSFDELIFQISAEYRTVRLESHVTKTLSTRKLKQ